jgi:hypothetical protein
VGSMGGVAVIRSPLTAVEKKNNTAKKKIHKSHKWDGTRDINELQIGERLRVRVRVYMFSITAHAPERDNITPP